MTEIQGKLILVRVSARFELARVRVIGIMIIVHCNSQDFKRTLFLRNFLFTPSALALSNYMYKKASITIFFTNKIHLRPPDDTGLV